MYVQFAGSWTSAETSQTEVKFGHNNRMYLSTVDYVDNSKFFKPNMLGGVMEYDVDLS